MRLTEILKPANIKIPLLATTKTEAISELVQMLASNGAVTDAKKVLDAVLDRGKSKGSGVFDATNKGKSKGSGVNAIRLESQSKGSGVIDSD
jgi:hypothetical protein